MNLFGSTNIKDTEQYPNILYTRYESASRATRVTNEFLVTGSRSPERCVFVVTRIEGKNNSREYTTHRCTPFN